MAPRRNNRKASGRPSKSQLSRIMKKAAANREKGLRMPLKKAWADFRAGKL